jgi:hypothetical protein
MGELDSVHDTIGPNDIRAMAHTCSTRSAKVEYFLPRGDIYMVQSTQNTSSELRTEGIPYAVLSLDRNTVLTRRTLNGDAFLAIDGFARSNVFGDKQLLFAFRDEDTKVSMGF